MVKDGKHRVIYWRENKGFLLFFFNMHTYSPSGTVTSFDNLLNDDEKMVSFERFEKVWEETPISFITHRRAAL